MHPNQATTASVTAAMDLSHSNTAGAAITLPQDAFAVLSKCIHTMQIYGDLKFLLFLILPVNFAEPIKDSLQKFRFFHLCGGLGKSME